MILLALQVYPNLTGFVHIQANPFDAYSASKTVTGARRVVSLFKDVDASFDTSRVCIKIASTWEGLQACKELESQHNIRTLATTLFTLEQAALAAQVGAATSRRTSTSCACISTRGEYTCAHANPPAQEDGELGTD